MSANASSYNPKHWISALDAVLTISSAAKCDPSAAAEILLNFTKFVSVEVFFTGYYVDDSMGSRDEQLPDLKSTISPVDWQAFFQAKNTDFELCWDKNLFIFHIYPSIEGLKGEPERTVTYANICFRRSDLEYFLKREREIAGRKFGDFWPRLAEEAVVYFLYNDPPVEGSQSQRKVVEDITDTLNSLNVEVGESSVKKLVSAVSARIRREKKSE